jgi:hypothetical protein
MYFADIRAPVVRNLQVNQSLVQFVLSEYIDMCDEEYCENEVSDKIVSDISSKVENKIIDLLVSETQIISVSLLIVEEFIQGGYASNMKLK